MSRVNSLGPPLIAGEWLREREANHEVGIDAGAVRSLSAKNEDGKTVSKTETNVKSERFEVCFPKSVSDSWIFIK